MRVFLKPASGKTVRDPVTGTPLPKDGASVTISTYWRRRIKDGSVTKSKPAPEKKTENKKDEIKTMPLSGSGGE